ncbi:hypothetical protein [Flagellimonas onchidii]|uniref:hypothetical protein n=1 Tax=Flagellimonas onchidii TaxID=2562684 RepID=UPI0010A612EE|nr:hypothetical protein [Allomuricauda onchidii]
MKIALFNIQNIFHRHIGLVERYADKNKVRWTEEFEALMLQQHRSQKDYDRMRVLSHFLGFDKEMHPPCFTIKNTMGQLILKRGVDKQIPKASHLTNWEGWAKVDSIPINKVATLNKAKVIKRVDPDILVLIEVEDRASLLEFNGNFLVSEQISPYKQIVFLGTNDPYRRGIGVLAKEGFNLESIKTHVNDFDCSGKPIFDMDLQQYKFKTIYGPDLEVLCTHFSNNTGNPDFFVNRQRIQSEYISSLFANQQINPAKHLILMGTLNAPAYSNAIAPIIKQTGLKDVAKHPYFMGDLDKGKDADYFRLGAYKMGINIKQRDYLMLSNALFDAVEDCGLVRKGMWHKQQPQWKMLKSLKNETHVASEHPLVWSKLNIQNML